MSTTQRHLTHTEQQVMDDALRRSAKIMDNTGTAWQAGVPPTDIGHIVGAVPRSYRYKLYKPNSDQYRKGIKGRWQAFNGYGWDNAEPPVLWHRQEPST